MNLSVAESNKELLGKYPKFISSILDVIVDSTRTEEFMPRAKQNAAKVFKFPNNMIYAAVVTCNFHRYFGILLLTTRIELEFWRWMD